MADEINEPIPEKLLIAIDNGENIILHGPGGCGKTYTLKEISIHLKKRSQIVYCTATTGVAAINLNVPEHKICSRTLHSWAGVGLAEGVAKKILAKVRSNEQAYNRWCSAQSLIIDEVSMLGADLFDKLDYIGRAIRNRPELPFGGIQLILSGDFLQLPPVKEEWCFRSEAWKTLNLIPFIFTEPKRYDDTEHFHMLLRVREGLHTPEDIKKLHARVRAYDRYLKILRETDPSELIDFIKPTLLFSTRKDVSYRNEEELEKLPGASLEFIAEDKFTPFNHHARYDHYIKLLDDMLPKSVAFKVGAQVMLRVNMDIKKGLVNGSRGVVLEMDPEYLYVRFINGEQLRVTRFVCVVEDKDGTAFRSQMPFILSWASTIHRAQGATLDYAICDLGSSVFAEGQAYVALSRIRNIRGLFISEFHPPCMKTNKHALKYSKELNRKALEYSTSPESEIRKVQSSGEDEDIEIREDIARMKGEEEPGEESS